MGYLVAPTLAMRLLGTSKAPTSEHVQMVEMKEESTSSTSFQKKEAHPGLGYLTPICMLLSLTGFPLQMTILGSMVGPSVGCRVGSRLTGGSVGCCDGSATGDFVGFLDGTDRGDLVGSKVGDKVGTASGSIVGRARGLLVGFAVGRKEGI